MGEERITLSGWREEIFLFISSGLRMPEDGGEEVLGGVEGTEVVGASWILVRAGRNWST